MLASDLGRGVVQIVTAALLISGRAEIWQLAVLAAAYGAFEAAFRPAAGGLLPQIVDGEHLQQANALMGLALNTGMVLGPALAGTLIALTGPGTAIAIHAATFAISAVFLVRIRAPRPDRTRSDDGQEGFWAELRGGCAKSRRAAGCGPSCPGLMASQLIALPGVLALGPVVADRDLGGPPPGARSRRRSASARSSATSPPCGSARAARCSAPRSRSSAARRSRSRSRSATRPQ
jgi:MFS family permease